MLDLKGRKKVTPFLEPIARGLRRVGLTPTSVTIVGLVITMGGAVLIALGELSWGAGIAGFGAFLDALDGPMARAAGTATLRGAFIDTISDRVGEVAIFTGLAVYLRDEPLGLILCVLSLAFSMLIPYIRARAESWGAEGRGGWMGRAERMLVVLWGVGLAGFGLPLMYPVLWTFTVLTALTVAQRIRRTWQQLPG